jgi:tryptophan synthase beta chain
MKSNQEIKTNCCVVKPKEWLVPRQWSGVAELGPCLDEELNIPYPISSGSMFFPRAVWELETANVKQIIPASLRKMLSLWRPTPIREASSLCKALGIESRIFYKDESSSPAYSYKLNSALPQAWFAAEEGIKGLVAYTLAGYWGIALAWACAKIGLDCRVIVPPQVFSQRPDLMREIRKYGADLQSIDCRPGREILENASQRFAVGCFLNAVVAFNSVIGIEAVEQLESMDVWPDAVVGACGGGTNFAGLILEFLMNKNIKERKRPRLIAVEPNVVGKLTHGTLKPVRILGPTGPVYNTLTSNTNQSANQENSCSPWAPGLTYPTTTPLIVALASQNLLESYECTENAAKEASMLFAKTEGIRPAPEAAYAVWGGVEAAKRMDKSESPGTVLFCLSGGHRLDR